MKKLNEYEHVCESIADYIESAKVYGLSNITVSVILLEDVLDILNEHATLQNQLSVAMSENQRLTKHVEDYKEENAALRGEVEHTSMLLKVSEKAHGGTISELAALRREVGEAKAMAWDIVVELAALVANPDSPDWMPALGNSNAADAECLQKAYNIAKDLLEACHE